LKRLEGCDDGTLNSDTRPDACRTDCAVAHCGDGVVDKDEQCDGGSANSDTDPGGCTLGCTIPYCTPAETPFSDYANSGTITGQRGDKMVVACNQGYSGGGQWICGDSGFFTGPSCTPTPCDSTQVPHSVAHFTSGSIAGGTGTTVEVTCQAGYQGGGAWTCRSTGEFDGTVCTPISCTPSEVAHSTGHATDGSLTGTTGTTVTVNCELGYSGGGTWTCTGNGAEPGTFTGQKCIGNPCLPTSLDNSSHATKDSIRGATGDIIEVECVSGFSGGGKWACKADGTFSVGEPCTPNPCDASVAPENGAVGDCTSVLQNAGVQFLLEQKLYQFS